MRAIPQVSLCVFAFCAIPTVCGCAQRSTLLIAPDLVDACHNAELPEQPIVVANYNIKSGMWTSLDQVFNVLSDMKPDIVALEEVDRGMARTGSVDQSAVLAERLGMKRIFAGAMERDGGTYGVALLSKLPVRSARRIELPRAYGAEPRVAIDAEICTPGQPLHVVAGHHDFTPWAAEAQARALAEVVGDRSDVLVLGDFNITPHTTGMRALIRRPLVDALGVYAEGETFEGVGRIDYILTDKPVVHAQILKHRASDHFPVTATLEFLDGIVRTPAQVARQP